ncbi:PPE-repeat containing protein [Mycobacteroides abscessus subsp. abscessus]|nr:PPE-repeat containing protein [Mycobacteroides abscessus subsp. abscessus]
MGSTAAAAKDMASANALRGIVSAIRAAYQGPAAEQAIAQIELVITWFETAATQGEIAAGELTGVGQAIASAIASVPHYTLVAENRVEFFTAIANNWFGILTPYIGYKEGEYTGMWIDAAVGRTTSDSAIAMGVSALPKHTAPPIPVNPGALGAALAEALGHLATAPMSGADLFAREMNSVALDGVLARDAAGHAAEAVPPGSKASMMGNVTDRKGAADKLGDTAKQFGEGGQQASSQMTSMLTQFTQLPAQMGQQVMQPMQQVTQVPQQFSQILQPLMQGGSGFNPGAAASLPEGTVFPSTMAGGTGNLAGAITRPAGLGGGFSGSGGGGGYSGVRMPAAVPLGANAVDGSAAANAARMASGAGGSGAMGGSGFMGGAPAHGQEEKRSSLANKYATGTQLGPAVPAKAG